ncbi:uncharacterized protein LOC135494695 [Lineus longissimus]|uniref:uncharacterized protein LOC135494695 n=1 Tax=Lineus longissimus TaxID=88925 RepID=UPI00315D5C85
MANDAGRTDDIHQLTHAIENSTQRLNLDFGLLQRQAGKLGTNVDTVDFRNEIENIYSNTCEAIKRVMSQLFDLQLLCVDKQKKSKYKSLKQKFESEVEKFCDLSAATRNKMAKFPTQDSLGGTTSIVAIQEDVGAVVDVMRHNVDKVLARNSVIGMGDMDTYTDQGRIDTMAMDSYYKKLVAQKRDLMAKDDRSLTPDERDRKRKLLTEIDDVMRMYNDLANIMEPEDAETLEAHGSYVRRNNERKTSKACRVS